MRTQHPLLRATGRLAAAAAMGVALLGVIARTADADSAFLRLDTIAGESTARGFENQIDVSAFGWSVSTPAASGGAGGGNPRASFQELSVTKAVDAASPSLFAAVATGRHLRDAVLSTVTAGERPEPYLRYCLQDVTVASLKQDGSGDARPVETVTFRYGQFAIAYGRQAADGSRTFVTQGWDLIRNIAAPAAC